MRVNLDVLNAQTQLFQTQRDLAKARYDVIVGSLRLRQASRAAQTEDLLAVNALLQRTEVAARPSPAPAGRCRCRASARAPRTAGRSCAWT
jgi:outer membrane protein